MLTSAALYIRGLEAFTILGYHSCTAGASFSCAARQFRRLRRINGNFIFAILGCNDFLPIRGVSSRSLVRRSVFT